MASIIEVARALRAPLEDRSIIPALAAGQIDDASPSTILRFVEQAAKHQDTVSEKNTDSKMFGAKIVDVKRIKREANGFTLGYKALIVMESSGSDGDNQEETIETGWVEFKGEDHPDNITDDRSVWEVALSRSIEEDAKALIGRSAFVRKVVVQPEGSQKRVRYIADIQRDYRDDGGDSKRSSSSDKGGRSSGRSSKGRGKSENVEVTEDSLREMAEGLKIEWASEFADLLNTKSWSGKAAEVAEYAADALGVKDKDFDTFVDDFFDARGEPVERALIAADKWL